MIIPHQSDPEHDVLIEFGLEQATKMLRRLRGRLLERGFEVGTGSADMSPQSYEQDPARITAKIGVDSPSLECTIVRDMFLDYLLWQCDPRERRRVNMHMQGCEQCDSYFVITANVIDSFIKCWSREEE